jgi:hypothetical protein
MGQAIERHGACKVFGAVWRAKKRYFSSFVRYLHAYAVGILPSAERYSSSFVYRFCAGERKNDTPENRK